MPIKPMHILRYGTVAEKVHLEKALSAYDCLSINGNSAAYVSNAIAKFIVEKFFSKPEKGFFIDPITYAFQNEIKLLKSKSKTTGEESIKKSVKKLIEFYGFPANKVEAGVPIIVDDFSSEDVKLEFCKRILQFQYNLVYSHIKENDLQKYLDYALPDAKNRIPQFRPQFLIAPYFYLDSQESSFDQWLNLNIEFANMACQISLENCDGKDIFTQIVISKAVLTNVECMNKIIESYKKTNCTGYTIWVDDLNEQESSEDELLGFIHLLKGLNGKPVYNMYGGYFSILLTHKSIGLLSGVSHGLEYGESRKVYPVGGGIPVSKYYYLPLHHRLDFTKAYYLLEHAGIVDTTKENWGSSKKYYSDICGCSQCKTVIGDDMINFVEFESKEFYEIHRKDQIMRRKKASSDTKQNCLYHYLLCKKWEFLRINKESINDLTNDLLSHKKNYESCDSLREGELDYLCTWTNVIKRK